MRPTDVISVFAPPLLARGVEWMVAGGVVAIVHGEPRHTQDLDIVAALGPAQAARLAGQFPAESMGLDAQWREMEALSE